MAGSIIYKSFNTMSNKYPFLEQNDISNCTLQDLSNIDKNSIMKLIL